MEETYMEEEVVQGIEDLLDLFMVVGRIQNEIWSTLPPPENKTIASLNVRQIQALTNLYLREQFEEEPVTLKQLGDLLSMKKKAAVSLMVSDLSKKKLVVREVDEKNRRYIRIHLTPTGRRLGEAICDRGVEVMNPLFDQAKERFDLTSRELKGFKKTVHGLCKAYHEQHG